MTDRTVLSLYDYSGNMARPWAAEGYDCICVDIQHVDDEYVEEVGDGTIEYVGADISEWIPPNEEYEIVFAFPPCTNLAVSGARWFKGKGLSGLASGIDDEDGDVIKSPYVAFSEYSHTDDKEQLHYCPNENCRIVRLLPGDSDE